ncbi:hypothetical protein [Desulfovibrio ferrophilus]|uniref:Uncharacterized protein n=1 Tax=Desulfovibrio ferrophilus TaxID=241368 RepID=A0A2Z6B4E2_9BACT|nr:hypothetical protein [Desulfovibrio ferrophilus]BBD10150.1 uncharacterized protein DFE_A0049 [Desulfovibrio ferrophilus]
MTNKSVILSFALATIAGAFLSLFLFVGMTHAATKAVLPIKTTLPIVIKETKDAKSVVAELNEEARQFGLGNMTLVGTIEYAPYEDNPEFTIARIKWRAAEYTAGDSGVSVELTAPLQTEFAANESRVDAGTELEAVGDLQSLLDDLTSLKDQASKATQGTAEKTEEKTETSETTSTSSLAPSSSGTSGSYDFSDDDGDFVNSDVTETKQEWQECSDRIALEEGRYYPQQKLVTLDGEGNVVSMGACEDKGGYELLPTETEMCTPFVDSAGSQLVLQEKTRWFDKDGNLLKVGDCVDIEGEDPIPAEKVYGDPCSVLNDFDAMRVYQSYREMANYDGVTYEVNSCHVDYDAYYQVLGDSSECGVRHDFANNLTIQQERLYYMDAATKTWLTLCQDSTTTYEHYAASCDALIDWDAGKVYPQSRIAYDTPDGTQYANTCTPETGVEYNLQTEYCTPKYDHDFNAATSYAMARAFYEIGGNREYVGDCARTPTESFEHRYDMDVCTMVHDDDALQTQLFAKTYIDTNDDGRIDLTDCQEYDLPKAYTYMGQVSKKMVFTVNDSWTVPDNVTNISLIMIASGSRSSYSCRWLPAGCDGQGYVFNNYFCDGGTGGFGGQIFEQQNVPVTPNETISITAGKLQNTSIVTQAETFSLSPGGGYPGRQGTQIFTETCYANYGDGNQKAVNCVDGTCKQTGGTGGNGQYLPADGNTYGQGETGAPGGTFILKYNSPNYDYLICNSTTVTGSPSATTQDYSKAFPRPDNHTGGAVAITYKVEQYRRFDGSILEKPVN